MRTFLASSAQINVNRKVSGRQRSYVNHHHPSRKKSGLDFQKISIGNSSSSRHRSGYDWDSMRIKSGVRRESSTSHLMDNLDDGVVAELELLRSIGDAEEDNNKAHKVSPNTRCTNGLYQKLDRNPFTRRKKQDRQRKISVKKRQGTLQNLTAIAKVYPQNNDDDVSEQRKDNEEKYKSDKKNDSSIRTLFDMIKQDKNGNVRMGDMLEFLELHEVLIPSDLRTF